jgi:hypothetical protein
MVLVFAVLNAGNCAVPRRLTDVYPSVQLRNGTDQQSKKAPEFLTSMNTGDADFCSLRALVADIRGFTVPGSSETNPHSIEAA